MSSNIDTNRVGDRIFVTNGVDPLAYIDLTKVNRGRKAKAIVRFKPTRKSRILKFFVRIVSR